MVQFICLMYNTFVITLVLLLGIHVGGSIMTASPTQSQSLVPIQESSPEAVAKLVKHPSCGTQESGDGDDAEVDCITESDGVKGKTDSVDDERKMRKIINLKRLHENKTGEDTFEEADMIRTKEGYGVVKCIFLEDAALKAGIELVSILSVDDQTSEEATYLEIV